MEVCKLTSSREPTDISRIVVIQSSGSGRGDVFAAAAKLLRTWVDTVNNFCDPGPPPFGANNTPIFPSNRSFSGLPFLTAG